jgi:hypothetical protein
MTTVPPLVGGQVKTFHPSIYAGILARRDIPEQMAELEAHGIGAIDLVVVNVKPFAPAVGAKLVGIDGSSNRRLAIARCAPPSRNCPPVTSIPRGTARAATR